MIRQATQEDLPKILEMSVKFYPLTTYWTLSRIELDIEHTTVLISTLIDKGVMLVAEVDQVVVGMIGLIVMPFLFNPNYTTAGEIIWWVDPKFWGDGIGRSLLKAIIDPCKSYDVRHIQMINLNNSPVQAGELYKSEGYVLTENVWTKVI